MLLGDREREIVKGKLVDLAGPVRLVMFTQEIECEYCRDTRDMVQQVADLADQVTAEIYNFVTDKEKAEELGVDKIPAIAVIGAQDYGVRFYGIPGGYEFAALLEAISDVAAGDSGLAPETRQFLADLPEDVHLQVFTTPT